MRKAMNVTAMVDGRRWYWQHARTCDVFKVAGKSRAWFLFDDRRDYVGSFRTKAEMLEYIQRIPTAEPPRSGHCH